MNSGSKEQRAREIAKYGSKVTYSRKQKYDINDSANEIITFIISSDVECYYCRSITNTLDSTNWTWEFIDDFSIDGYQCDALCKDCYYRFRPWYSMLICHS